MRHDDKAVNELIGTILLMGIAVGLVGVFILILFSIPGPTPSSHTDLQAFISPTTPNALVLEHRGGPAIPIRELIALVTVNGTTTSYDVGDNIGGAWAVRSAAGSSKSATDSFGLGDQAIFTSVTLYRAAASVTVVDNNEAALTLGATVVANADPTAPTFSGSRTTSTTTLAVNFTESLRAIAAADFTVGGSPPSSVTLLGNGSSAEFTVAAFATDATPAVASIASPTGTLDVAGNLFGGGASSTPTDGVAPAITVAAAASTTSSSATITWTTGETGTSVVAFGPTPSDLGLSASGASGTSHSATLTSLTDNYRYHYTVSTADAAGNTVTSSTATFTTAAGGGGGSGAAVPHHLGFSTTVATLNPGINSTDYVVTLYDANGTVVIPVVPITVNVTTSSGTGAVLNATTLTQESSFVISTAQSTATFRYRDDRTNGGIALLCAAAHNVIGDCVASTVNDRNWVARAGESASSVEAFLIYVAEEDDSDATNIGLSILNPTPTAKTVSSVSFTATGNTAIEFTTFSTAAGSDGWFDSCTWSASPSNTPTCTATFAIPAFSMAQLVMAFTAPASGDDGFNISASVTLSGPITITTPALPVRHEATNNAAFMNEFFPLSGADKVAGIQNLTANVPVTLSFRIEEVAVFSTEAEVRLTIPPGWKDIEVPTAAQWDSTAIHVQQPTATQPGYVAFTYTLADLTFSIEMTPPNRAGSFDLLRGEIAHVGGSPAARSYHVWGVTIV